MTMSMLVVLPFLLLAPVYSELSVDYPFHFTLDVVENVTASTRDDLINQVQAEVDADREQNLTRQIPPKNKTFGPAPYMHLLDKKVAENALRNKTLRLVVPAIEAPYVNYVDFTDEAEKEKGYGPGVVIEILKIIQQSLNLTYEIVDTTDHTWGSLDNGTWTGAFGDLVNDRADVICGAAIMQFDRSLISDLTYPFQFEYTGMMIQSPQKYQNNALLIVTEPFKWQVWVVTIGSIIASGFILVFLTSSLGKVYDEVQFGVFGGIWVFFSIFVQQGLPRQPHSWSCRTMIALWWLSSITLMATFTGSLVALFAAAAKPIYPFTDVDGLYRAVRDNKYIIVMDMNSRTRTDMIARSQLPAYKGLWYEMSVNKKVRYVNGTERGAKFVLENPGYVFLGPMDTLSYYAYIDCRLTVLSEGILPVYLSIPLQKDSPYSTYFSNRIREIVELGFTQKWTSDYTSYLESNRSLQQCNQSIPTSRTTQSYLDINRSQGAFWVLIIGLVLAVAFLFAEMLYRFGQRLYMKRREHHDKKSYVGSARKSVDDSVSESEQGAVEGSRPTAIDTAVLGPALNANWTTNGPDDQGRGLEQKFSEYQEKSSSPSLRRRNVLNLTVEIPRDGYDSDSFINVPL